MMINVADMLLAARVRAGQCSLQEILAIYKSATESGNMRLALLSMKVIDLMRRDERLAAIDGLKCSVGTKVMEAKR